MLDVARLILWAEKHGFQLTGGELWRPPEMQKIYIETGRSWTTESKHLDRLAIDFNVFINGQLVNDWTTVKPLGDYWESLSVRNRWGGDFNKNEIKDGRIDMPHFERCA